MFKLALEWNEKEYYESINDFRHGTAVLCVKPEGFVLKLTVNKEKGGFVDRLGNVYDFEDFVEFCDMCIEEDEEY